MSIAILNQVYDEMRRLAIAGSVVAGGDFRLKKLVPPLEQAGAKAPVFAKVAEAVKNVVDGDAKNSAGALLDLTTLVNAILYTQGETGLEGKLTPIETTDLGASTSQASARVIKPLLEALTTTGSGRLEVIRDAHERGAFKDLRLVKPALEAIDDVYGEIGDLIAEKILPIYGKAILPELRAKLDLKGKGGHPRRLKLMHALDPKGTRETITQALENGSKEVKVVAIECLGDDNEDLSYLIEQASAKAQDVRQAAFRALAKIDDEAAVATLKKALAEKDFETAARAMAVEPSARLVKFILAEVDDIVSNLHSYKDEKIGKGRVQGVIPLLSSQLTRADMLLECLAGRADKETEKLLLDLFGQREKLSKFKGISKSGADLNSTVVRLLRQGSKKSQTTLAEAHEMLDADDLGHAFHAARAALSKDKVFKMFSPYLTAKVDEKKKSRDPAFAKREAILRELGADGDSHYWWWRRDDDKLEALDPGWLDVAVSSKNVALVSQLGHPKHAGAMAFLKKTFDETFKKSKSLDDCHGALASMIHAKHPDATDAFCDALRKHATKANYYHYWYARMMSDLPKSAIPKLEALAAELGDKFADSLIDGIQELRQKP